MKKLIRKISRKQYDSILNKRATEDLDFIKAADDFFIKKRGYSFKQPKSGSKAILLLSGGIDSTVAWATLIEVYGYKVYPVILDRGSNKRAKKELAAVRFLEKYFAKRYPDNYVKPFHLTVNTIAKEFKDTVNPKNVLAEDILANFNQNKWFVKDESNVVLARTKGISPYLMPFYGVVYSDYLKFTQGIDIKNIFVGANFTDGSEVSSQSFTALRSTLLGICTATANYDWNFSSVFLERETGILLEKGGTVELGMKLGIPLEKTWSCYNSSIFQCGDACATCVSRKDAFAQIGAKDKTIYISDIKNRIVGSFKFHLKQLINFFS